MFCLDVIYFKQTYLHKFKLRKDFTDATYKVAECTLVHRKLFVKIVGEISIKYANMSNKYL